ncbi:SAM-dependent DNA methyltransferase [Candidatus Sumerlaeota bacterium]|nr:SAM-dependent DNA methyltransferase [Candidatus Sumerlaeota bacterium]
MIASRESRKRLGQVFTPEDVARTLVRWAVRRKTDHLLDPSCGDGRFLAHHAVSTGIELDRENARLAQERVPGATIHHTEFFTWASSTTCRFEAVAGNPPFIRYQHFAGRTRQLAIELAQRAGSTINGLASSWASFLVVTAGLLKPDGRMAFVVPAEIGHAPYASPVLSFLCSRFRQVRIVAIREKLFPDLSEDAWLLFADGFGGRTDVVELSLFDGFASFEWTGRPTRRVSLSSWRDAGCRLRKFLLSDSHLALYEASASRAGVSRLGEVANTGIGYVSGGNEFFHLRPSEAKRYGIPGRLLRIAIRRSRQLPADCVSRQTVEGWISQDEPVMLLDLRGAQKLPSTVMAYLNSERGREVRKGYKCRNRDPWYAIPDVRVPDAFLSYMSGRKPAFVRNDTECVCTNSVHAVSSKNGMSLRTIQQAWSHPLVDLSCELEGHPLGGGMLKMEPREASNVLVPIGNPHFTPSEIRILKEATAEMRGWRNYD